MSGIVATLIIISVLVLIGAKSIERTEINSFMSIEQTEFLRAVACIIIIFVHIPVQYGNVLQNLIGSFAYVGVMIFFMISAYGCCWGADNKKDYIKFFWEKRLLSLLVPAFIINFIEMTVKSIFMKKENTYMVLVNINYYIYAILILYIVFYVFYKIKWQDKYRKVTISIIAITLSLIGFFTKNTFLSYWPSESMGFVLGILLYSYREKFSKFLRSNTVKKIAIFLSLGIILGITYLKIKSVFFWGDYVVRVILGYILIILVFLMLSRYTIKGKILKLGKISWEIYLAHIMIINTLLEIINQRRLNISSNVFIITVFLLTLLVSVFVYKMTDVILKRVNTKQRSKSSGN